jgi:hypothetical protein
VQALRPLDGLAGLRPHQCFELPCRHDRLRPAVATIRLTIALALI